MFSNTLWFLNSKYLPILKPLYEPATNLFIVGPQILVTHVYCRTTNLAVKLCDLAKRNEQNVYSMKKAVLEIKW